MCGFCLFSLCAAIAEQIMIILGKRKHYKTREMRSLNFGIEKSVINIKMDLFKDI